ncbi:phenazine biosynthesis protein PhzF family [Cyclobacterium xiamenense]|uniref:Phenazine biosynthesis protein PhzF family n=1 Tax=Cyclobacterium xiamenense TaxID=1297121 RepID=A0A1H7AI16_9BACT|nr:PhzF family phenazine biosynthesis protein [Cyclobacterium xiamenense]SEJ65273.1 phenazine biosynthesis protein PhzF family [Cyclobacterium xiamenense]
MHPPIIAVFTAPELGFRGNPAAVVRSKHALTPEQMQAQAREIGMPATSFLLEDADGSYRVRWFAPDAEIALCGHGAAAAGVFLAQQTQVETVLLQYSGGQIAVKVAGNRFEMRLHAIPVTGQVAVPQAIKDGLAIPVLEMYQTENKHLILTDSEASVAAMQPDFDRLRESDIFGYAVTAKGDTVDFVSRTLVPHVQQLEDHATGSSHALLVPFWAPKLGKNQLVSHQLSPRGGRFFAELANDTVVLSGTFARE